MEERNEGEREVKWGVRKIRGETDVKREMRRHKGEMRDKGEKTEI